MENPKEEPQAPKDGAELLSDPGAPEGDRTGFLVMKMRDGDGFLILPDIEIRLHSSRNNRAEVAIRAPRGKTIKRIPQEPEK